MKLAKLNDFRRKLGNSHPLNGITKITTPQGEELQTFLVSSVCGLNGSGKTRLLREIAQDLSPVTFDGVTITKTDANPTYINPSILVSYTLERYREYGESLRETAEQYDPFIFDAPLLQRVNYILHSDFAEINIHNVETLQGQEKTEAGTFAYCTATKHGIQLDNESLSHGELYVILICWLLATLEENLILIDEAEAFLSPVAQSRLANALIQISVEPKDNNRQLFIATHSPFILNAIGFQNSFTLSKNVFGVRLKPASKDILDKIGIATSEQNILLVEDKKAGLLLSLILDSLVPAWKHSNIILVCNGEGDLREITSRIKDVIGGRIIPVYDGDIHDKSPLSEAEKKFSAVLPGKLAPEQLLIEKIRENPESFVARWGSERREAIADGMEAVKGLDIHDYFIELSRKCNVHEQEIFTTAFYSWFESNQNECMKFIIELSRMSAR